MKLSPGKRKAFLRQLAELTSTRSKKIVKTKSKEFGTNMYERTSNDKLESSPGSGSIHTEIRMDSKVSSGKKKSKKSRQSPDKSDTKVSKRSQKSNSPE